MRLSPESHDFGDYLPDWRGGGFDIADGEMGVSHGHTDIGVAKQAGYRRHGHAFHNRMAGKRVAQVTEANDLNAGFAVDCKRLA